MRAPLCCVCWGTQVAVICGRNKKLLAELQRTQWPGGSHVVACGFVDNIHEVGAVNPACQVKSKQTPNLAEIWDGTAVIRGSAGLVALSSRS
jgi:hypothetical protein